jgi:pSer/pThr/pTyr-binding forkhead associated (FHA) protein
VIRSVELVVSKEGSPDRVVELMPGTVRIGRADDNELVLADVSVSRRHARLVVDAKSVTIDDLGSGNGTYYRGEELQTQELQNGDAIVIEPFVLKFRIQNQNLSLVIDPGSGARLLVTASDGLGPEAFVIPAGGVTLGRSDECDITLPDAAASRVHARIVETPGGYQLLDEDSANGVFANGERVSAHWLKQGDEVRVGDTFFQFQEASSTQGHSVTDQQYNLSEMGEETNWSKDLTLPSPDNRLVTDPRITAGERKTNPLLSVFAVGLVLLLGLFSVLVVLVLIVVLIATGTL